MLAVSHCALGECTLDAVSGVANDMCESMSCKRPPKGRTLQKWCCCMRTRQKSFPFCCIAMKLTIASSLERSQRLLLFLAYRLLVSCPAISRVLPCNPPSSSALEEEDERNVLAVSSRCSCAENILSVHDRNYTLHLCDPLRRNADLEQREGLGNGCHLTGRKIFVAGMCGWEFVWCTHAGFSHERHCAAALVFFRSERRKIQNGSKKEFRFGSDREGSIKSRKKGRMRETWTEGTKENRHAHLHTLFARYPCEAEVSASPDRAHCGQPEIVFWF